MIFMTVYWTVLEKPISCLNNYNPKGFDSGSGFMPFLLYLEKYKYIKAAIIL